jgi:hypothetical protein
VVIQDEIAKCRVCSRPVTLDEYGDVVHDNGLYSCTPGNKGLEWVSVAVRKSPLVAKLRSPLVAS